MRWHSIGRIRDEIDEPGVRGRSLPLLGTSHRCCPSGVNASVVVVVVVVTNNGFAHRVIVVAFYSLRESNHSVVDGDDNPVMPGGLAACLS